ncbi:class I SAM-dependent methyltransferase [Rhodanobacter sp. DHB23]|uniref:class I SAM-dependent methyltransferase n=1 Tax=Rhodanobacter sp. DHB23 TaxID=2775923 RepID=UPI0017844BE0|nr:class I SAM-dependent methyltransferase [Rhodanobacter sp. DHB23]MBD8872124.1 class I SAM-dependent methyltransferase [Rhodanobacter sp. DHB23]
MSVARSAHWDAVYREKTADQTSWFRPHLDESLRLIDALDMPRELPVLDVGGGRSTLADDLLARGYTDVGVLDISAVAVAESKQRLAAQAPSVHWVVGDVVDLDLPAARVALWHDRAVFHFLTDADERARYVATARHALRPGGHLVIGTFAADGPERCSGLAVTRYDAPALAAVFAPGFRLVSRSRDVHRTPSGNEQAFTYVVLQRCGDGVDA